MTGAIFYVKTFKNASDADYRYCNLFVNTKYVYCKKIVVEKYTIGIEV